MSAVPALPFEDSRRLTGSNLYFDDAGAVLETVGDIPSATMLGAWRTRVMRLRTELGWPDGPIVARPHATGASLAFAAPIDQLLTATEVNEWAWLASLGERAEPDGEASSDLSVAFPERLGHSPSSALRAPSAGGRREDEALLPFSLRDRSRLQRLRVPEGRMREAADDLPGSGAEAHIALLHAPGHPAAWDEESALHTLHAHARAERNPALAELVALAQARRLTVLIDDDELSIGSGAGSQRWPLASLPLPSAIDWNALHDIPVALVTGSNGKTTSVRLLAAIVRAQGLRAVYSCTDGLFIGDVVLEAGDYSGPAGARALLRHAQAEVAILETARGGILRRGIAPQHARAAIVTNISDDHFGEYGVHTLDDLAAVKLTVARVVDADGMLVLNADDAVLARHAASLARPLGWFALDDAHPLLVNHREHGGATCGVQAGRLVLTRRGTTHDLGAVADMPLTFGARASYNIANCAAAALAATALDIAPHTIADVLARFGTAHEDNPGRLQRWSVGPTQVLLDYAHNPEGLRALLEVAAGARETGRLVLVLGQAGNRGDAEVRELAAVAAGFHPDRIVLKDIAGMLRGRAAGEIPAILRAELVRNGVPDGAIIECLDEADAARTAIAWARPGDIVVLPIHSAQARAEIVNLLDALALG